MHKVKFDSELDGNFTDYGEEYEKDLKGNTVVIKKLPKPFKIKAGQELEIDDETFQYLLEKGSIRTKAEEKERQRLRKKLLVKRSGRAEPKKEMQTIPDEDRYIIFTELPHEV